MIQRLRDRRTLFLILGMPLIQLLLFAYAVDLTADHLPTVVADMSLDTHSRTFIDALQTSGFFDVRTYVANEREVLQAIDTGEAQAGVVIPPGFAEQIERGDAQALVILDGSDSFSVSAGYSAATAIAQAYSLDLIAEKLNRMGQRTEHVAHRFIDARALQPQPERPGLHSAGPDRDAAASAGGEYDRAVRRPRIRTRHHRANPGDAHPPMANWSSANSHPTSSLSSSTS